MVRSLIKSNIEVADYPRRRLEPTDCHADKAADGIKVHEATCP